MKAKKEEIIKAAKKIIEQCFRTKIIEKSIQVKERKVALFPFENNGYYEHDGWYFMGDDLNFPEDSIHISFLDDGTPIDAGFALSEGSSSLKYIIKDTDDNYKLLLNKKDYFEHHNFDFTKKEFEFKRSDY